jgi:hypothetical protein
MTRLKYTHVQRHAMKKMMGEVDRFFRENLEHLLSRLLFLVEPHYPVKMGGG